MSGPFKIELEAKHDADTATVTITQFSMVVECGADFATTSALPMATERVAYTQTFAVISGAAFPMDRRRGVATRNDSRCRDGYLERNSYHSRPLLFLGSNQRQGGCERN